MIGKDTKYVDGQSMKQEPLAWEHTTQSEADQKVMEFTNLVSNLEMTEIFCK